MSKRPQLSAQLADLKLRKSQLSNDLEAAKATISRLADENDNFRRSHALQSKALVDALRERDDWRDAFKLIMRLVK
jgi:hypothetical protein